MSPRFLGQLIILLLVVTQASFGAIRTVSQDVTAGGQYTKIQDALDAAQEGDEIVILDFATYKEQVTIKKNRITLRSQTPTLLSKPIIQYQDKTNVGPTNCVDALIEEKITFDQNGAVRVMRAQGAKIEGIIIDGIGPAPFAYPSIWTCKDALFHGNVALTLFIAGDVVVRNCELRNAYFGIYVKDRNEGGIFANSNPADLATWRVVPLSGFGKTGNHLFEYNRIHNNSWGTFFESTWDLGSTIRYNLIYENHHMTTAFATTVKGLNPAEGGNQIGGAFLFKDMILSPVAIYNNTFWHNHAIFAAHWKAGVQHLIFNNIYAEPYILWAKNPVFPNPFMDVTANFVNRMNNCLFACQMQKPDTQTQNMQWNIQDTIGGTNKPLQISKAYSFTSRVPITNDIQVSEKAGQDYVMTLTLGAGTPNEHDTTKIWHEAQAIQPGALITGATAAVAYPKAASNRWLEPKFQSTDPTDPRFLTPDWDDPIMKQFIVDQGWPEAGIRDADGSIADIGAISYTKRQETVALIKPTEPIAISGTVATAAFNLTTIAGTINNPVIQYVKWIDLPKYVGTEFGPVKTLILQPATNIFNVTPSVSTVKEGLNKFTFAVPARNATNAFGFLEIVIRGTDAAGDTVTSNVGFLPYRALAYKFLVKIFDKDDKIQKTELTEVRAGDVVLMKVLPLDSSGKVISAPINAAEATLEESDTLYNDKMQPFAFSPNFTKKDSTYLVIFTKVPPNGGLQMVSVSGKFTDNVSEQPIRGSSGEIKILPGPADHVLFYDPPSNGVKVVNPGSSVTVTAKVYDKFGNLVDKTNSGEKTVTLKSTKIAVGDVDGVATQTIDDTGSVYFKIKVTGGKEKDTFPIVATLPTKGTFDNAKGVVGKPRDKFYIFYGDTVGGYVDAAKIEGVCGDRYPVTIIASTNGTDILTTRKDTRFDIDFPGNTGILNAYMDQDDTIPISQYQLTNGKAIIWITSTGNSVSNGEIFIYSSTDASIIKNSRLNIFFTAPQYRIKSGAYYADNGNGQVNRLEIYYEDTLKSANLPDSIELYWPRKSDASKITVKNKSMMTLDPANNKHVTVKLDTPFDTSVTASSGGTNQLGTVYWRNPATPAAPVQVVKFNIADSVGPLLASATLIERIGDGDDTLYITFTELIPVANIQGKSLQVIKNNEADTVDLDIKAAADIGSNVIRIVVENAAGNSPVAGDLLKIKAAGTITDQFNNKAQKDNRPVIIKIKPISADMVSASYYDKNADGIVDLLTIQFNKNVAKENFKVFAVWDAGANKVKDTISDAGISDGADKKELAVNLDGVFTTVPTDVTSGSLSVVARNLGFSSGPPKTATDKAAPVLVSADYYPGAISESKSAPDTLKMVFSELVTTVPDLEPFVFYDKSSSYSVKLENPPSSKATQYTYIVTSTTKFPINGDSVNIGSGKIADQSNNFQENVKNKRVPLTVHEVPYTLIPKIGPNPFIPKLDPNDITGRVKLVLTPVTKMVEKIKLSANLIIYDQMGNVVAKKDTLSGTDGTIVFYWNGRNNNGRLVGAGTYVAIIKTTDLNSKKPEKYTFKIGVRR